ncbi:hypothetical protein LVD15_00360 [Fulvivirga maritima]|uniref:hypothetical protein n=1 Tax=Fulvivirga maritima TaxID=2904247 RepID=UPI001F300AC6|nr:hypothetical protein [Fulvivirga maritima]UII26924.1 hypothetical protein LVD15_00360 [Fulvivirga maritima]
MHRIIIVFFIFLVSCGHNRDEVESVNQNLIIALIEKCILADSLNYHGFIDSELQHYEYYELEFTDKGISYPPPQGSQWLNETTIVEQLEEPQYFDDSVTRQYLKSQIINSKKIVNKVNLSSLGDDKLGVKFQNDESWYIFYLPIFNADSSAVYVQYDYFDSGYEEGKAAIFLKNNKQWEYTKFILRWMR